MRTRLSAVTNASSPAEKNPAARSPRPGLKTQRTPSEAVRSPAAGPAARSGASIRIPAESATAGRPASPPARRIPVATVNSAESPAMAVMPSSTLGPISAVTPPDAAQSPGAPSGPTENLALPARTRIDGPAGGCRLKTTEPSASADETRPRRKDTSTLSAAMDPPSRTSRRGPGRSTRAWPSKRAESRALSSPAAVNESDEEPPLMRPSENAARPSTRPRRSPLRYVSDSPERTIGPDVPPGAARAASNPPPSRISPALSE